MRHVLCGLAGLALAAVLFSWQDSVTAQIDPLPFRVGDKIRLLYENSGGQACDVVDIKGHFVLCAQREPNGEWLNLLTTLGVDLKR
jgi:hypothetical protein